MNGVLVLDKTYRPVRFVTKTKDIQRLVTLTIMGKVTVLAEYENIQYHSEFLTINIPKVVSLHVLVPIEKGSKRVKPVLVYARDNYTCVYCQKDEDTLLEKDHKNKLTVDHVKPISRYNGRNRAEQKMKAHTWENCVTACKKCNLKKDNRLPMECGMIPRKNNKPYTPIQPSMVSVKLFGDLKHLNKEQKTYVEPWVKKKK